MSLYFHIILKYYPRLILSLMLLLCVIAPLRSQINSSTNPYFDNLTRERGLVQSNIRAIVSDHKGYVWLGSSDGLYKWDGLSLSIYRDKKNNPSSLSDDNISALYHDPNNSGLWIGTVFGGINHLNYSTGEFRHWLPVVKKDEEGKQYLNNVTSLCQINDSMMLAGTTAQGLFLMNLKQGELTINRQIEHADDRAGYRVYSIKKTDDKIYAGTSKGLFIFSDNGELYFSEARFLLNGKAEKLVKDFTMLPDGKMIFATHNALWHWDQEALKANPIPLDHSINHITRLSTDHNNNLWAGTLNDGLFHINPENNRVIQYTTPESNDENKGLVHNQINDLLFYNHQPILMAATPAGISTLDFERRLFQQYDLRKLSEAGNTSVFFVMQDTRKRHWFWSLDGLYRQTEPDGRFKKILDSDIGSNLNMVKDGLEINGGLWFATSNGLLEMHVEDTDKKWHFFEHTELSKVTLNTITALKADTLGRIWLISPAGTIIFDPESKDYTVFPFPLADWHDNSIPVTDLVLSESNKSCWIGSKSQYLFHFDEPSGNYQRISTLVANQDASQSIRANYVLSMDTDSRGRLWLASFGSGLLYLDEKNMTLNDDYATSTLAGNTYAIVHGNDNHLWVSTDYGITRFNPITNSLNEFGLDEGTFCQEFNERAAYQTPEGTILMGGTNGFIRFNPSDFQFNEYIPPVYISTYSVGNPNITIGGENMRDVRVIRSKSINIPYSREVISFEISVLNFRHPGKNQIAWKLEGFDKEWSQAPASHIISYSNLPPGKYRLKVQGSNNHGIWNTDGDSLTIHIQAPFYQRPWFEWVFGGLIALLITLVFLLRTRLLSRQKKLLSKLVRERTKNLHKAYAELEKSKKKVMSQNKELELHRNDLEKLVAQRTEDLEKAKKRAEESDHLKTAFLANLSHEIRTPMNAIVGFSTLLNSMEFSDEDKAGFITLIQQSGDNLLALINDIIDISRIETGQLALHPGYFKIGPFLDNIIKSLAFEPNKSNEVALHLDVPPEIWDLNAYTDEHRLRQVIVNLLNNALKFTSEGYVKLSVEKFKGHDIQTFLPLMKSMNVPENILLFIIEDTGIGISEEHLSDIFIPFRKIEPSGGNIYGGMGLGLSIVKSILPALGGNITLNSISGHGTTFYFYIPDNGQQ